MSYSLEWAKRDSACISFWLCEIWIGHWFANCDNYKELCAGVDENNICLIRRFNIRYKKKHCRFLLTRKHLFALLCGPLSNLVASSSFFVLFTLKNRVAKFKICNEHWPWQKLKCLFQKSNKANFNSIIEVDSTLSYF